MKLWILLVILALAACAETPDLLPPAPETPAPVGLDAEIAHYAELYGLPESLIRRSIKRESGGNPSARHGPYWGLMQIRVETARGLGYKGEPKGLLNAGTNLKYAAAYLANAYRVGGHNADRAMRLYASGYYWEARRKHMLDQLITPAKVEAADSETR